MADFKQLWLLAGGNGVGKSTFYRCFLQDSGMSFINADLIAKQIDPDNPEAQSYHAAAIAEKLRTSFLQKGISFCFETVFSHPSKIDFIAQAKSYGYETNLVYIHLQSAELNLARISQRVSEGGHSVPEEKVIARIPRTMKNIQASLPLVDNAFFYDNSSRKNPFNTVAKLAHRKLEIKQQPLPDWASRLLQDYV